MTQPEPLIERFKRFLRSSLVGILATVSDFVVLELCVRALGVDQSLSKIPALAVGTTIQFIGSRHFAFRAQRGPLGRQMRWFVLAEALAFGLTVLVFHALVRYLRLPIEVANLISGSIVYFGFSYPIWKRVFTVPSATASDAPAEPGAGARPSRAEFDRAA